MLENEVNDKDRKGEKGERKERGMGKDIDTER